MSKALWGHHRHRRSVAPRRQPVRESLSVTASSSLHQVARRNHFRHSGERIDRREQESSHHDMPDRVIGPPTAVAGLTETATSRVSDPTPPTGPRSVSWVRLFSSGVILPGIELRGWGGWWTRHFSRRRRQRRYSPKSPLVRKARSSRTASAPAEPQRAPVRSRRSLTRWRHAPHTQVGLLVEQMGAAGVSALPAGWGHATPGDAAARGTGHMAGLAPERDPTPLEVG